MAYFPGVGAFEQLFGARGGGNLNTNFLKIQMPGGGLPGARILKLRFDRYISINSHSLMCSDL